LAALAGKNLAVLSNKLQRLTQQALEAIDLARFFTVIQGGGSDFPLKPAPNHLLALTADLGVNPARTLMVGDKPADIQAGQGAGAWTAAVTYGYGDQDSLRAASPDFLLQQFPQLPDILAG
jgi:HAD superfamily hydrolase (TIGR01509 family)